VKKGGFKPDSFCYPYGAYNRTTVEAVKKAGFTTVMTCGEDWADSRNSKLLKLQRLWVRGGRHEFAVNKLAVEDGYGCCRLEHKGIPIPVSVHLTWAGNPPGEIWQKRKRARSGDVRMVVEAASAVKDARSCGLRFGTRTVSSGCFSYP